MFRAALASEFTPEILQVRDGVEALALRDRVLTLPFLQHLLWMPSWEEGGPPSWTWEAKQQEVIW